MRDIFIFGSSSEAGSSSEQAGSSSAIEHAGSRTAIARQVTQSRRNLLGVGLELQHLTGAQPQTSEQSRRQHESEAALMAEADDAVLEAEVLNRITLLTKMFKATSDARLGEGVKLEIEKYLEILGTKIKKLEKQKDDKLQTKNESKKKSKIKALEKQIGDTESQLTELRKQREKFEENKKGVETLLQFIQMKKA